VTSSRPRLGGTPSRALTTFAVGFLLLDAILLIYSGATLGRTRLVVWGAVFIVVAGLVVIGWRRYRRLMADLEQARHDMRAEIESIRALLHEKHLHN
jgi:hypothetical protein